MSTIHIQSGKNNLETNLNGKIQYVPFKIHADADAKVSKYFEAYVKKGEEFATCSFRGYPLRGNKINIPDGYKGVILHESIRPSTEKEERKFYVMNTFESIMYWNWDKVPSQNDAMRQALDWIDIADALHSSIEEE